MARRFVRRVRDEGSEETALGADEGNGSRAVTAANFKAEVMSSSVPFVVGFRATWCRTSRDMAPTIHELAEEYRGRIAFGNVDVDVELALVQELGVQMIPTLLVYKAGALVAPLVGLHTKAAIESVLAEHL